MKDERPASALAALEALFAPRKAEAPASAPKPSARSSAKMVTAKPYDSDPRAVEKTKLLERVLTAEGQPAVTRRANELLRAGFTFAEEQEVQLALLQHADEALVRACLATLSKLLEDQAPKRKTVLEARLRWLEEAAEETTTRELAGALRRRVSGALRGRTL